MQRCAQHPDNVWALHGLVECLKQRGESDELPGLEAKLAAALARADVPITLVVPLPDKRANRRLLLSLRQAVAGLN